MQLAGRDELLRVLEKELEAVDRLFTQFMPLLRRQAVLKLLLDLDRSNREFIKELFRTVVDVFRTA